MNTGPASAHYPFITWLLYSGALGLLLWLSAVAARAEDAPPPWPLTADAVVLMNLQDGEMLFAKQPNEPHAPASTTKILTALIALERLDLNAKAPVSAKAAGVMPTRVGLQAGDSVYIGDLLYGLLLKSGNDAAETLAEAVAGSVENFAQLMNASAKELGAQNSHFTNPHGLPDKQHFSTAYDMALIFRRAMQNPVFAEIVRTHNADLRVEQQDGAAGWRLVSVQNSNRLLKGYDGAVGGKTGFTRAAKNCFVGEARRGGVTLLVSVLGSAGKAALWQDVRALLDYGFSRYGLAPPTELTTVQTAAAPAGRAPAHDDQGD